MNGATPHPHIDRAACPWPMRVDRDAEFVLGTDRRTARDATPVDMRETLWAAGVLVGDVVVCT